MNNENVSCVSNNCNQDSGGVQNSKLEHQVKKLHCSNENLNNIPDDANDDASNNESLDEINVDVEDLSHLDGLTITDAERLLSELSIDNLNNDDEAGGSTENRNEQESASLQNSNIPNATSTDESSPNAVVNDDDYIVMDPLYLELFVDVIHQLFPHLYDLPLDD